jgi:hypothetical protein
MSDNRKPSEETDIEYRASGPMSASSRAIRAMFGQTLRQLHEVPRETPHHLLAILMQLDESQQADPPRDGPAQQRDACR